MEVLLNNKVLRIIRNFRISSPFQLIPEGIYCYTRTNGNFVLCPFWRSGYDSNGEFIGICDLLGKSDNDLGVGLLWDQCKHCGINEGYSEYDDY